MNHTPSKPIVQLLLLFGCFLLPIPGTFAQNARPGNTPEIAYVYPAGGRRGTTFTVTIGGRRLEKVSAAFFSSTAVQAEVTGYHRFLTQKEFTDIQENIRLLKEKKTAAKKRPPGWTDLDETELAALQARLVDRPNRQVPLTLAETITLEVRLPADTPAGMHELRLKTPAGLSNPCFFQVGNLPEFTEPRAERTRADIPSSDNTNTLNVDLPVLVNGRIMPAETDRFRFTARRGQRLVFAVSARALIPYLADAVPGWFQATLGLYDSAGTELAYVDDFHFEPDPVLSCEIPADGDYTLVIKDAIHRGREDFVYRIAAGEFPFVTGIFPLGGPQGVGTPVVLSGWNLPVATLELPRAGPQTENSWAAMWGIDAALERVLFAQSTDPETTEREPNDTPTGSQTVTLPVTINGKIQRAGDPDVFRFEARAGDRIVAEVIARRLHSPLDSSLLLEDAKGQKISLNDDHADKSAGLITHQADSFIQVTLPTDGVYFLTVQDTQQRGGEDFSYRLRIGPPKPDFTVMLTPSTINLRAGTNLPVTAHIVRRDGFEGAVDLALTHAPPGLTLAGGRLFPGQTRTVLTLTAPANMKPLTAPLTFTASAQIADRKVTRPVAPADERMQAFLPRHLVPAKTLMVDVTAGARWKNSPAVIADIPLRIPAGGSAPFRVRATSPKDAANMHFELIDPPDGIALSSSVKEAGEIEVRVTCDAAKQKPGFQDNLIITVAIERPASADSGKPRPAAKTSLGNLPAIPFEIVSP